MTGANWSPREREAAFCLSPLSDLRRKSSAPEGNADSNTCDEPEPESGPGPAPPPPRPADRRRLAPPVSTRRVPTPPVSDARTAAVPRAREPVQPALDQPGCHPPPRQLGTGSTGSTPAPSSTSRGECRPQEGQVGLVGGRTRAEGRRGKGLDRRNPPPDQAGASSLHTHRETPSNRDSRADILEPPLDPRNRTGPTIRSLLPPRTVPLRPFLPKRTATSTTGILIRRIITSSSPTRYRRSSKNRRAQAILSWGWGGMGLEGQGRVGSGGRGRRRCRHGEGFSRRRQRLDVARPARLYADGEETLDLTQAAVPPRAFDLLLNPSLKKLISQRFAKDRSVDAEIARCLGDELEARMKAFSSASIDVCVWSKKKKAVKWSA